jgi:4-amino-4-deoxy-L-arabinose transferase-like glycosyltransferase
MKRWMISALVVGALVALGAVVRFVGLTQAPPYLWHDEAVNGLNMLRLLDGERPLYFITDEHPHEPLFAYLQWGWFSVLRAIGWSDLPDIFSLRTCAAMIGLLTLPLFYLLAQQLLPRRWAWLALLLFALLPWHVHFSRLGFRTIITPMLTCATGLMLHEWLRRGRPMTAAILGTTSALCFYTYLGAFVLPIVVIVAALASLLLKCAGTFAVAHPTPLQLPESDESIVHESQKIPLTEDEASASQRRIWLGVGIGLLVGGLAVFPLLRYLLFTEDAVWVRLQQARNVEEQFTLVGNFVKLVGFFAWTGDPQFRHGVVGRPLFPLYLLPVLLTGLFVWGRNLRGRAGLRIYLVLSLLGYFAGSLFSAEAPHKLRTLGAAPVVVLLLVDGLRWLVLQARHRKLPQPAITGAVVLLLGAYLMQEAVALKKQWYSDAEVFESFSGGFSEVAQWANGAPLPYDQKTPREDWVVRDPDIPFYVSWGVGEHSSFRYLTTLTPNTNYFLELEKALANPLQEADQVYLLVTALAQENLQILQQIGITGQYVASVVNPYHEGIWGSIYLFNTLPQGFSQQQQAWADRYIIDLGLDLAPLRSGGAPE